MAKVCKECGKETDRLFSCEHTEGAELCVECYQKLHYELTNK
ncbi:MAG: hypothetical protein ACE5JV_01575 [Nitrososphaerales archaeon]